MRPISAKYNKNLCRPPYIANKHKLHKLCIILTQMHEMHAEIDIKVSVKHGNLGSQQWLSPPPTWRRSPPQEKYISFQRI